MDRDKENYDNGHVVEEDGKQGKEKFYGNMCVILIALIFAAPLGIFLLWRYQKDTNKNTKIVLTLIFGGLFIYSLVPSGNSKINVSAYFPNQPMEKIYYTYIGEEVFSVTESFIENGTKKNVLVWKERLYLNNDGNLKSNGIREGVYELYTDEVISIETYGGFQTDKERLILSNASKWSTTKNEDKSYINDGTYRVQVEAGMFYDCLEVITKTETKNGIYMNRDYYAPGIGVILSEGKEVSKGDDIESEPFMKISELIEYEIY